MALTDKNLIITPNIGSSNDPKIDFIGASAAVGPSTITATIYSTNNGTLSFDGTEGSLFSISNNLSTGSIFSVNPISGIPIIDVNADRTIALNPYGGNTGIGTTNPSQKLHVAGNLRVTGAIYDSNNSPGINNQVLKSTGVGVTWVSGSGSGVDADTLDGLTSDSFLRSDTSDTYSGGILTVTTVAGRTGNSATGSLAALEIFQPNANTDAFIAFHVSGDYAGYFGLDGTTNDLFWGGWSVGAVKNKIWHAGNDGAGSGLDADLLDGLNSATANTASTIVARDASGNFTAGTITAALTGNASTATTLQTTRTIWGQNFNGGANVSGALTGATDITASGTIKGNQIVGGTGSAIGSAGLIVNGTTGDNDSQLIIKKPSQSAFSVLSWDGAVYLASNIYYNDGGWVQSAPTGNNNNQMLTFSPGTGVRWYASNNGSGSWNVASDLQLWSDAGVWQRPLSNTLTLNTSGTGLSGSTTFNNSGAATFTVTSNATSANTGSTIVARDASGNFTAGNITATNFSDGTGTYNVNLGSGGTEGRGLVAGYSGASYGGIGYNVRHSSSGATWIAPSTDTSSYLLFTAGGFAFYGAAAGAAGRTLSYTSLATLGSTGNLTLNGTSHTAGGNTIWHAGNDGAGSGLDADLLDGLNSTSFIRSDANQTATGAYLFSKNNPAVSNASYSTPNNHIEFRTDNGSDVILGFHKSGVSATALYHSGYGINSLRIRNADGNDGPIFTTFNDGAGSGLDADLLDGLNSATANTVSTIVARDGSGNFSAGTITSSNLVVSGNGSTLYGPNTSWGQYLRVGGNGNADTTNASIVTTDGNLHIDAKTSSATYINYYKGTAGTGFGNGASAVVAFMGPDGDLWKGNADNTGSVYWHAGNDGAGSGLDADTVDGLEVHTGTNNVANRIVRTDANGYIQAGWINTISGNLGVTTRLDRVYSSNDQYIRYLGLTDFKNQMGLSSKNNYSRAVDYTADSNYWVGSFGHNGYGANETFHGGSGFFDIWSGTNYPSGLTHIHGINMLHYTTSSLGTTGGNAYGWQMAAQYDSNAGPWWRRCNAGTFSAWSKIWSDVNDGAGSGLDADLLDGLNSATANTVSTIVARDGSGNFSAGTITAALSGNSTTATTLQTARNINGVSFNGSADITVTANTPNTLTLNTSGTGLSGSTTFNGGSATTFTVTSNATSANTVSTIVARDGSGNFSAGTITAALSGNATTASSTPGCTFSNDSTNKADITTRTDSGFYEHDTATTAEGWPITSNTWMHMIACTHSNDANYYSMQIAASFFNNTDLYYRSTNASGTTAWSKIWNSSNDGTGSGLDADLLDGQQGSYYQDASNLNAGTVPVLRLGSSGTRDNTTFLRGDNTWATVVSGVSITDETTPATRYIAFTTANTGTTTSINVSSSRLTYNPSTSTLFTDGSVEIGATDSATQKFSIDFNETTDSLDFTYTA